MWKENVLSDMIRFFLPDILPRRLPAPFIQIAMSHCHSPVPPSLVLKSYDNFKFAALLGEDLFFYYNYL